MVSTKSMSQQRRSKIAFLPVFYLLPTTTLVGSPILLAPVAGLHPRLRRLCLRADVGQHGVQDQENWTGQREMVDEVRHMGGKAAFRICSPRCAASNTSVVELLGIIRTKRRGHHSHRVQARETSQQLDPVVGGNSTSTVNSSGTATCTTTLTCPASYPRISLQLWLKSVTSHLHFSGRSWPNSRFCGSLWIGFVGEIQRMGCRWRPEQRLFFQQDVIGLAASFADSALPPCRSCC